MSLRLKADKDTRGVIAVDLDSTLAEYTEWKGIEHIGKPIPAMLARVKKWLEENGIGGLKITNVKSMDIVEFWDDRAVQVIPNTGERADGKK